LRLIIISGLSGSGKSVALNTLEDAGYYCIDNLPVGLLEAFKDHLSNASEDAADHYAVGIDARNRLEALERLPTILQGINNSGLDCEILFLDARHETLIKRFKETRRRHPLGGPDTGTTLTEAIARESELLHTLRERADLTIDTTQTSVHELRELVWQRLVREPSTLSILLESFGYKHGSPTDADFVFDARCLPNPYWDPALRGLTGRDSAVADYLAGHPDVQAFRDEVCGFLSRWIPCFQRENRSYLTIAIGCTGGQHRSVYLVEQLASLLREDGNLMTTRHRELA
jgi:UPF0042 nucleotide-binding protein